MNPIYLNHRVPIVLVKSWMPLERLLGRSPLMSMSMAYPMLLSSCVRRTVQLL